MSDGSFVEHLMPEGKAVLCCGYEAALNNVWVDQVGLNVDSIEVRVAVYLCSGDNSVTRER